MISHSMSSLQIGLGVLVVLSSVTTTISDNIDLVDIEGHIPPPIKRADKGVMPILPICESFAETLADAAANYTQCFIANARPMHLCTKCVEKYLAVKHAYHQLDAVCIYFKRFATITRDKHVHGPDNSWKRRNT